MNTWTPVHVLRLFSEIAHPSFEFSVPLSGDDRDTTCFR